MLQSIRNFLTQVIFISPKQIGRTIKMHRAVAYNRDVSETYDRAFRKAWRIERKECKYTLTCISFLLFSLAALYLAGFIIMHLPTISRARSIWTWIFRMLVLVFADGLLFAKVKTIYELLDKAFLGAATAANKATKEARAAKKAKQEKEKTATEARVEAANRARKSVAEAATKTAKKKATTEAAKKNAETSANEGEERRNSVSEPLTTVPSRRSSDAQKAFAKMMAGK